MSSRSGTPNEKQRIAAARDRGLAVGLYATFYYIGGSVGAALPGLAWHIAGWPGCVAMVIAMLIVMATVVSLAWRD